MSAAHELMAIPETPGQKKNIDNWYAADRQGWFGMMRTLVYNARWDRFWIKTYSSHFSTAGNCVVPLGTRYCFRSEKRRKWRKPRSKRNG